MLTALVVAAVLVVLLIAAVAATHEGDVLVDAPADASDVGLPELLVQPEDIAEVRFGMALRGYRMSEVDHVLERLAQELAGRDAQIAKLQDALVAAPQTVEAAEPLTTWRTPAPHNPAPQVVSWSPEPTAPAAVPALDEPAVVQDPAPEPGAAAVVEEDPAAQEDLGPQEPAEPDASQSEPTPAPVTSSSWWETSPVSQPGSTPEPAVPTSAETPETSETSETSETPETPIPPLEVPQAATPATPRADSAFADDDFPEVLAPEAAAAELPDAEEATARPVGAPAPPATSRTWSTPVLPSAPPAETPPGGEGSTSP